MDLAQAADIMASSLRGFGLEARDAARVSNILAQTSAMLGIMANAGIKGSQGGTAIRAAFLRLSKEPKAVAKALGQLGISTVRSREYAGHA